MFSIKPNVAKRVKWFFKMMFKCLASSRRWKRFRSTRTSLRSSKRRWWEILFDFLFMFLLFLKHVAHPSVQLSPLVSPFINFSLSHASSSLLLYSSISLFTVDMISIYWYIRLQSSTSKTSWRLFLCFSYMPILASFFLCFSVFFWFSVSHINVYRLQSSTSETSWRPSRRRNSPWTKKKAPGYQIILMKIMTRITMKIMLNIFMRIMMMEFQFRCLPFSGKNWIKFEWKTSKFHDPEHLLSPDQRKSDIKSVLKNAVLSNLFIVINLIALHC